MTVWLLGTPGTCATRPAPFPGETAQEPGVLTAEIVSRALDAFAPRTASARPGSAVVLTRPTTLATQPTGAGGGVRLVVLDATRSAVEVSGVDELAAVLLPGGVLAVLTVSDHVKGRLRDPRPALIASARAAGLDYMQHIVTAQPPNPGPGPHDGGGGEGGPGWRGCLVADVVAEVSVFHRPAAHQLVDQEFHDADREGPDAPGEEVQS